LQRSLLRPVGKSRCSKTTNLLKPPQGLTHPKRSGTVRWLKSDCHRIFDTGLEIKPHCLPSSSTTTTTTTTSPSHRPSEKQPYPTTFLEPCQILIYATGYTGTLHCCLRLPALRPGTSKSSLQASPPSAP
jgi:hypothetical protein